MSDLSDLQRLTPAKSEQLENLALSLARVERQLDELAQYLGHQQNSLARTRKELITILWPKAATTEKEIA